MADKDTKKDSKDVPDAATPGFDPKPMQIGGESLLDRLLPHMKKIVVAILLTALVLGVVFFVIWLKDRKHAKETDRLAVVLEVADRPVRDPGTPVDPKAKDPTFGDVKERATAVLDALAKENTDAAGPTYRASLLVQAGKLDEAILEYRKAQGQLGLDGVLAREGLGLAIEMRAEAEKDAAARQKGLEEALTTFQTMQPDEKGPRRAFALYHQGRVLAILGKRADAKTALEKAKELGKDVAELPELIDQRLASLGT